jgi:hypothetical protein
MRVMTRLFSSALVIVAACRTPGWAQEPPGDCPTASHSVSVVLVGDDYGDPLVRDALLLAVPWADVSDELFPKLDVPVRVESRRGDHDPETIEDDARYLRYEPDRARILLRIRRFYRFEPVVVVTFDTGRSRDTVDSQECERPEMGIEERRSRVDDLIASALERIGISMVKHSKERRKKLEDQLDDQNFDFPRPVIWVEAVVRWKQR